MKHMRKILRFYRRRLLASVGAMIVVSVILVALLTPWISPTDPLAQDVHKSLRPPIWHPGSDTAYPLGTDPLGRDLLSRVLYGARTSLIAAFFAALVATAIGVFLGLIAGYYGGRVGVGIMRLVDLQLALPSILLALVIIAILGSSLRNLIIVMGITSWMTYARVVRANVLSIKEKDFITAARSIGVKDLRIILRHILPNTLAPIIVILTFDIARLIILESSLSYLGLGVPPPTPSWGRMLYEGKEFMIIAYWLVAFPGLAIMITVMGINFLGDGLRDALDPTLRRML
jgi:peptide/nickel transport system permease protein